MFWFLKKSRILLADSRADQALTDEPTLVKMVDISDLDSDPVAVKIWLPQSLAQTLRWAADHQGESQSEWIRASLTAYVYGRAAVLALRIREERARRTRDGREPGGADTAFARGPVDRGAGRWVYKVPQLGKNTVAFKLWIGKQVRDDLQLLARHASLELSPFVREVIVGDLLGRGTLPERPEIIGPPTPAALAWESGDDVPIASVEAAEFDELGEAEAVWVRDGEDGSLESAK